MKEKLLNSIEYIGIFIVTLLIIIVVAYLINRFFKRLIRRSTEEMKNDPTNYKFFGDSSVNLRGWAWAKYPLDAFIMECELFEIIKQRFKDEEIEMPFPHRTLVYKNNQTNIRKEFYE